MNTLSTLKSWLHPAAPSKPAAVTPAERQTIHDASAAEAEELAHAQARDAEELAREKANEADAAKKLAGAQHRRVEIETRMLSRSLEHGVREAARKTALSAGAPEFVDRFLMDMDILSDETRLLGEVIGSEDRQRDEISGALGASTIATNTASVRRRLDAIHAARTRAQALKLEVDVNEDRIKSTLRELLAGLPAVEGAMRETGPLFTPAEVRHAEWRREGAAR